VAARLAEDLGGDGPIAVYSSTLRRAIETAGAIGAAFGVEPTQDCGLCTWHSPAYADGMPTEQFLVEHGIEGGGVFRTFQEGNECWAELVVRNGKAIMDIAHRHRGETVVLVGHTETVNSAFDVLGAQPLYRAFDLSVAPASITEWVTDEDPTVLPPARWTLCRFGEAGHTRGV
jgi:broad specificity phosphatase PhoE